MKLPADRSKWTPKHATRALITRDRAWQAYESYAGRSQERSTELFGLYQKAEDTAQDVCNVTGVKAARIV